MRGAQEAETDSHMTAWTSMQLTCFVEDTLAERLRRQPAKPMGSPHVDSNPTGVDLQGVVRVANGS